MQTQWWYIDGDDTVGPLSSDEMRARIAQGELSGEYLVWTPEATDWMPLAETALHVVEEPAPVVAPAPQTQWWYAINGVKEGPCSQTQLNELIQNHVLQPQHLVWTQGYAQWTPVADVPEFAALLVEARLLPPPLPASPPPVIPQAPAAVPDEPQPPERIVVLETNAVVFNEPSVKEESVAAPVRPMSSTQPMYAREPAQRPQPKVEATPASNNEAAVAPASAYPWRRFFARLVDMTLLGLPTAIVVGVVGSLLSLNFAIWLQNPGASTVLGWLLMPLFLLIEAAIYGMFGSTPGKALLGIVVKSGNGEQLSGADYAGRLRKLYWGGIGTGFPLVAWIMAIRQFIHCQRNRSTTYDAAGGFMVEGKPLGVVRWVSASVVVLAMVAVQLMLTMAAG